MLSNDHSDLFIFAIPGGKRPTTARKTHICRLYDILQLCIQRNDLERARRAWSILVRCKEINWKLMWRMGLTILSEGRDNSSAERDGKHLEYLSTMMLQFAEAREPIIQEMVLRLICSGEYERALEELELYLPSPPYEDNPTLHIYAALICIYFAQPEVSRHSSQEASQKSKSTTWDDVMLRRAQRYLDRALILDPRDVVAKGWLEKLPTLAQRPHRDESPDSDDEQMAIDSEQGDSRPKRARTGFT
ncbi:hypothetical protein NM688_g4720 [Phlebia brevispora]|uniref:Uncharacterized protein n=1 Tax=Phlebia brevispora TaxID=194682 RepID=A0ACC1T261_9APHY|nr:hypothetical protein NM688_g4720 [Phlebia brevispora]